MDVKKIIQEVRDGNLVITPTDTVYGILAKSSDEEVIKKVYEAKQRAKNKSFIVLIGNLDMLDSVAVNVTDIHKELIQRYWPGKLTIIFKKNDMVSDLLTGGKDTIAVRYPNYSELVDIINGVGEPLISTSANISNNDTIVDVSMIEPELSKYISYVSDGGKIEALSSTIVCVEDGTVKILREGDLASDIRKNFNIS